MKSRRLYEIHADICQALTHPTRLEIIDLLRDGEKGVFIYRFRPIQLPYAVTVGQDRLPVLHDDHGEARHRPIPLSGGDKGIQTSSIRSLGRARCRKECDGQENRYV